MGQYVGAVVDTVLAVPTPYVLGDTLITQIAVLPLAVVPVSWKYIQYLEVLYHY